MDLLAHALLPDQGLGCPRVHLWVCGAGISAQLVGATEQAGWGCGVWAEANLREKIAFARLYMVETGEMEDLESVCRGLGQLR